MKDVFSFNSKTDFEKWHKGFKDTNRIIDQGISPEEAVALSDYIDNECTFAKQIIAESLL